MKIDFDHKKYSGNNAPLMRCPNCGAQAADNAAFCPKCDCILDPSLFLDEPLPEAPEEDTNPGIRLREEAPSSSSSRGDIPRRKPSRQQPVSSPKAPSGKILDESGKSEGGLEPEWFPEKPEKSEFHEAEMLLSSLKADFGALSGPDKLMIVGALGMVLSCFFPWQSLERSGEVLGFLSLGAWVVPLAIGSFSGMLWRKRTYELFPLLPWLLQGLSGLIAVVLCLVLAKMFWVSASAAELMGAHAESSTPSLGLFLGLVFAILNLAGTGFGLKRGG
jgi:hypothetical protein